MLTENEEKMIEDIMEWFDFEKVKAVMNFLDWKWRGETPTIYDIKRTARRLLEDAIKTEKDSIFGTGGFSARKKIWDNGEYDLELRFDIASWDASSRDNKTIKDKNGM